MGEASGYLSSCVAGEVFILDVFEMNELVIKSLMSDTYITIKKADCQSLTL